jgi:arylsulfatase A-like enzyme
MKISHPLGLALGGALVLGAISTGWAADESLPKPDPAFKGKVAAKREESVPAWPESTKAPEGAPNVLVVLLDDVGYGASRVFGGPVQTPALEKLAASGLSYNRFHVNSLCSPTRGSLLTGRNNHQIGFGTITEGSSGYPGYNSVWPKSAVSTAEVLRQNGYSTAAFGKWHNTPVWEVSPAGPFDHWPTSLGFEYFYGFMAAAGSQWEPCLYRNTTAVDAPAKPAQGYHLTIDLANDAIRWLHTHDAVAPDKPFYLYFATGATHTPHHVPKEWVAKYKGQFNQGWDKLREETFARQKKLGVIPADAELTARPKELPAWDSLSADQKKLLAHQMEVYAGFLAQTDYEVGRVLQAIKDEGKSDNTLVLYIVGDNGASGEGGLTGYENGGAYDTKTAAISTRLEHLDDFGSEVFSNHYAAAWAWGLNTPYQWMKQVSSHLGGTRDPLIVSWPARIKDAGGVRAQFTHVTDIAPTIFEATGVKFPESVNGVQQIPLEGKSLVFTFDNAQAPSIHNLQYFEMVGNRGIYKDGWWAGARHILPWELSAQRYQTPIGQHPWELYDLDHDFSQAHDLAATYPEKLKELQDAFDAEAKRNNVYPLTPLPGEGRPSPANGKTSFTYRSGVARLPSGVTPNLAGRSQRIVADLEVPAAGAEGVIIAQGGRNGGFSLYVKDGKLIYEANTFTPNHEKVESAQPLPHGKVEVAFEFTADASGGTAQNGFTGIATRDVGGQARLSINGKQVAEGHFAHLYPLNSGTETLDVGSDTGSPVSNYESPFSFTGVVDKVTVDLL